MRLAGTRECSSSVADVRATHEGILSRPPDTGIPLAALKKARVMLTL
jgi:hypothetical protein